MENNVMPYDFNGDAVRVIMGDDAPWFVGRDVCGVLGTDPRNIPAILEQDEHQTLYSIEGLNEFNGLRKDTRLVSESGLYSLIFRSRKPEARKFRKWVTSVVLPSIRKNGAFALSGPARPCPRLPCD